MARLNDKRILLGVTGSIAAYKSAFLARQLMREGADVRVIMSSSAAEFISPLTFSTLTGHPVLNTLTTEEGWENHVKWGRWADLFLIAPLTAQSLAKMANGFADNMLTACYLSSESPVFIAPAMDLDMWNHPSTRRNIRTVEKDGVRLLPPDSGLLASGLEGTGRMMEPDEICEKVLDYFNESPGMFEGKSILITAGPTREALDPIRFLSNGSSGKTGIALAEEARRRGARVSLVLGPTHLRPDSDAIDLYEVESAREMYERCRTLFPDSDITLFCAAVSDFRPKQVAEHKIKKSKEDMALQFERNPDIAARLGDVKQKGQFTVGFALETKEGEENALQKLREKNFDMIVLNLAGSGGSGMGSDYNQVRFLYPDNKSRSFELKTKEEIASDLLDAIAKQIHVKT